MLLLNTLDCTIPQPTAIAVGYFDGLHRGHLAVINEALKQKQNGLLACVFSFEMFSDMPVAKRGAKLISTPTLKRQQLEALGTDVFLYPSFSSFMGMSPEQYAVDLLYRRLGARVVCCGYDYKFAKGAAANAYDLKRLLQPYGVEVILMDAVLDEGEPISSTRIRNALFAGDLTTATRLLGHDFSVDFPVSHGKKLGSRLGFPTANQIIEQPFLAPRFGVYATAVEIDGQSYPAVTNVGVKPTVGSDQIAAESYILGFAGDLYGRRIVTTFFEFLRDEKKFDSLDALRDAIAQDAATAQRLHQSKLQG